MVILYYVSILLSTMEGIPPLQLPMHLLFLLLPVTELPWNFSDALTSYYTKLTANSPSEEHAESSFCLFVNKLSK